MVMVNTILIICVTGVLIFGIVSMVFDFSGMNKRHNNAMEGMTINFIKTMKQLHTASAGFGIMEDAPDVTYFVPCYPGLYNKLLGNVKLCLFIHEYRITETLKVEKSRQFLVVSKEQFFFMQLKGWIGTKDREKAVKAICHLKEMVSLP